MGDRQISDQIRLVLLGITQLMPHLMTGCKRQGKHGIRRIHLRFPGKWVIISSKADIITRITIQRGLNGSKGIT